MKGVWAFRSPSKHNKKQHSFQGEGSHGRVPHPWTHKAPAACFLLTLSSSVLNKTLSWLSEALLSGTTTHILKCDQETPPELDLSYLKFLLINILVKTGKDIHGAQVLIELTESERTSHWTWMKEAVKDVGTRQTCNLFPLHPALGCRIRTCQCTS